MPSKFSGMLVLSECQEMGSSGGPWLDKANRVVAVQSRILGYRTETVHVNGFVAVQSRDMCYKSNILGYKAEAESSFLRPPVESEVPPAESEVIFFILSIGSRISEEDLVFVVKRSLRARRKGRLEIKDFK